MTKGGNKPLVWLALILTIVGFAPIFCAIGAGSVASALGCRLDEGSVHPCMLGGTDIGETLYAFGVMGWLELLTFPVALGGMGLWAFLAIRRIGALIRRSR